MAVQLWSSSSYIPELNDVTVRLNSTLIRTTNAMLYSTGMNSHFGADGIMEVAHSYTSPETPPIGLKTPHEKKYGTPRNTSKMRVFGCTANQCLHDGRIGHELD